MHQLQENKWLFSLYDIRDNWIPIFSKHIFSARMRTTPRSETMNSFFDKYVNRKNALAEFVMQFERTVSHQRYIENNDDHENIDTKPHIETCLDMVRQMAEVLTRVSFFKFQTTLREGIAYGTVLITNENNGSSHHPGRSKNHY